MVLSMTGYGRAEQVLNGRDIVVELRSVNSRFFEYSSRVPRTCSFLEDKLKKLVAAKVRRGKVELNLSIQNVAAADTVVQVNWQLAKSYQTAMQAMSEKLDQKVPPGLRRGRYFAGPPLCRRAGARTESRF